LSTLDIGAFGGAAPVKTCAGKREVVAPNPLLMVAEALEIDRAEFFHLAYPRPSASPAGGGDSLLGGAR